MKKKCEYFRINEILIRQNWQQNGFFTAYYWYSLVLNAKDTIENNRGQLWKRPRWFADQLFDTYYSIFLIACLIEYAAQEPCTHELKLAIHLLFGDKHLIIIKPNLTKKL